MSTIIPPAILANLATAQPGDVLYERRHPKRHLFKVQICYKQFDHWTFDYIVDFMTGERGSAHAGGGSDLKEAIAYILKRVDEADHNFPNDPFIAQIRADLTETQLTLF